MIIIQVAIFVKFMQTINNFSPFFKIILVTHDEIATYSINGF